MKKTSGFSLIEVMVVIAIIGALAAIALPMYRDYTIRASVAEALEDADAQRVVVEVALIDGKSSNWKSGPVRWELAAPSKDPKQPVGHLVANLDVAGMGNKDVLALRRLNDGSWLCVNAAMAGSAIALEEKYLPASCHGAGSAMAAKASGCPAGQEMVALPTGPACTAKCPAGQQRDSTNPSQCKEIICAPNERKNGSGQCVDLGPQPNCEPGGDPHIAYSYDNTPSWYCFPKCEAGKVRDPGNWFSCIADPNAKPAVAPPAAPVAAPAAAAQPAATPPAAATVPASAPASTPPPKLPAVPPSTQCHVCDPALPPELCQGASIEQTCSYPTNWCVTSVTNHADGTKDVTRRCGDFPNDVEREWFQGTSDDDKCRDIVDTTQPFEFDCTFACNTPNCNRSGRSLRPPEDSLYQPK